MTEPAPEGTAPALQNYVPSTTSTASGANLTFPVNTGYQTTPSQFFTAEDLEKARREERDKLYGRITRSDERFRTLEDEIKKLQEERDRRASEEEQRRQAAEQALKAKAEEELSAKQLLEQQRAEWENRFQDMARQQEQARAVYEKDQAYLKLKNYIERRAREETANETIGPELIDFINGSTEEEVEASITLLREKTTRILNSVRDGTTATRALMPGVGITGQPPTGGPLDNLPSTSKQWTKEDIDAIPPNEWGKYRGQFGLQDNNKGMYQ